jgi:hypothetical protein
MSIKVLVALDMLLEALSEEYKHLANAVREATLQESFAEAQRLLAQAERLRHIGETVRKLRTAWETPELPLPTPENRVISDLKEVPTLQAIDLNLQHQIPPTEKTPELEIVEQIFGNNTGQSKPCPKRGTAEVTHQWEFREPILEALEELEGRGEARQVLNIVYKRMKEKFKENDLEQLTSGEVRWRKMAMWERYNMVRDGLLRSDSPRGIWEISEAGWAYLENIRGRGHREGHS